MINRISEIPYWGPEEQIRRFINQHDDNNVLYGISLSQMLDGEAGLELSDDENGIEDEKEKFETVVKRWSIHCCGYDKDYSELDENEKEIVDNKIAELTGKYTTNQNTVTQARISNLDDIFQKQLIWSYGRSVDDAYFYWDWCPIGSGLSIESPRWQIVAWEEYQKNLERNMDRTFNWKEFRGYRNSDTQDEMVLDYDAADDVHTKDSNIFDLDNQTTLDVNTLRHNISCSLLEVSEWLGYEDALKYGSHNGFVSRKMSLRWLFGAIRALINWKMNSHDRYGEVDIHPLVMDGTSEDATIHECFLSQGKASSCGHDYNDSADLDMGAGRCAVQTKARAARPWESGVQVVRGNEFHYGERADFYTHNSFIGECRFFHNARFLGQTTFDKEINGTAMRSRWADLAEYKEADKQYEPGTLVMFGGEKEITISRKGVANAIVTTKPGLALNGADYPGKIMVGIALTGTVPVKVVGKVKKFDRLVASKKFPGYARKRKWYEFWKKPIAIALESWSTGGMINCMTKMEF